MYIRKRKNKTGSTSVQIIQKHQGQYKVLKHIGTAGNQTELEYLLSHAEDVKKQLDRQLNFSSACDDKKQKELQQFLSRFETPSFSKVGFFEVFGKIYDDLRIVEVISDPLLKDLVVARIANPTSKMSTVRWLNTYHPDLVTPIEKDSVYRFLDKLTSKKQREVSNHVYKFVRDYLNDEIHILFFDATTIHFETFNSDKLRKLGYSKVAKHNQPQVVVGLMVTREGLPVGYEVFPGDTFDGHAIRAALKKVSRNYSIKRVIFVADAAMLSQENIKLLQEGDFEYIMAARIKNTNNKTKLKILDKKNYRRNIFEIEKYGQFKHRLIVTYSESRAKKDKYDRDKRVVKLKKRLTKTKMLTKSEVGILGKKKYMKIIGNATISLDIKAIEEDALWDGLKGYATNVKDLDNTEIIEKYHELWQVEEAFRVSKTDLKMRPVYHHKRERIRAHILLVFISLVVARLLTLSFKDQHIGIERIVENLDGVVEFPLMDRKINASVRIRPVMSEFNQNLYATLGLSIPEGIYPHNSSH